MFCPFCGNENRGGKKFCRQCGRAVPMPRAYDVKAGEEKPAPGFGNRAMDNGKANVYSSPPAAPVLRVSAEPVVAEDVSAEQLNEPTAQLLPDTENFESPPESPYTPYLGEGSEKPAEGAYCPWPPRVMEMPAVPKAIPLAAPSPVPSSAPSPWRFEPEAVDDTPRSIPVEPPPSGSNSGELTSTDEMEALDKTIEPVTPKISSADASAERSREDFLQ